MRRDLALIATISAVVMLLVCTMAVCSVADDASAEDAVDTGFTKLGSTNVQYKIDSGSSPIQLTVKPIGDATAMRDGSNSLNFTGSNTLITRIIGSNDTVKSSISGCKVIVSGFTSLPSNTFANSEIALFESDSVKVLSDYAFSGCKKLISVKLASGATSIGNSSFQNCSVLESVRSCDDANCSYGVHLPDVTDGGNGSFYYCQSIVTVKMEKMTSIGNEMFRAGSDYNNRSSLKEIQAPNLTSLGYRCFWNCVLSTDFVSVITSSPCS